MFKVNHLGKVKSSFMLDPQILTEAKVQATRVHLILGNIIEEALTEYLKDQKDKENLQKEKQRSSTTPTTTK